MILLNCFLLAFGAGVLFAAAFVFPQLFPLTWISLIPLFHTIQRVGTRQKAFLIGWAAGLIINVLGFYWLFYTIKVFGGYNFAVAVVIFLFLAAYSGLAFALFSLFVKLCGFGPLCLYPALFWTAIEFWFPNLFPWYVANSQANFLTLIQTADLVGPYGTSFLLVWFNTVCCQSLRDLNFSTVRFTALARNPTIVLSVLILVLVYGVFRLSAVARQVSEAPILKVAAVQGNIDVEMGGNVARMEKNLKTYEDLTLTIGDAAALVIWPESAMEFSFPQSLSQLPPKLRPTLPSEATLLAFGGRSFVGNSASTGARFFNSAFLADSHGRILARYDKQMLLMFGEYVPFFSILSRLGLTPENSGVFAPGSGPEILETPSRVKLAPLICYEDLMPELARQFILQTNSPLLINFTNDAWFGKTAAPWQHARLAQWRAIETRRAMVRATNTGLTTVIDPRGELVETIPVFARGVLISQVPLMDENTLYVRFGDWFAWLVTLISVAATVVTFGTRLAALRGPRFTYS